MSLLNNQYNGKQEYFFRGSPVVWKFQRIQIGHINLAMKILVNQKYGMTQHLATWNEMTWMWVLQHDTRSRFLVCFILPHFFLSRLVAWYLPHFRFDSVDRWFVVTSLTSPYRLKYQGWTAGHQLLCPKMMELHGKSMENHLEIMGNLWDDMGMGMKIGWLEYFRKLGYMIYIYICVRLGLMISIMGNLRVPKRPTLAARFPPRNRAEKLKNPLIRHYSGWVASQ